MLGASAMADATGLSISSRVATAADADWDGTSIR
jgi:hypothetical protein